MIDIKKYISETIDFLFKPSSGSVPGSTTIQEKISALVLAITSAGANHAADMIAANILKNSSSIYDTASVGGTLITFILTFAIAYIHKRNASGEEVKK